MGTNTRRAFVSVVALTVVCFLTSTYYDLQPGTLDSARRWRWNGSALLAYEKVYNVSVLLTDVVSSLASTKLWTSPSQREGRLLLLYWNMGHWRKDWTWGEGDRPLSSCPDLIGKCEFTSNHSRLNESEVLLFHMRDKIQWPPHRLPHQKWVFSLQECPVFTYIKMAGLQGLFNLTMTYARTAAVSWLYGSCRRLSPGETSTYNASRNYAAGKKHLVAWFVGHCRTPSRREDYAAALAEHIDLHKFGCGGGYRCPKWDNRRCHNVLLNNDYKFYLSFENSLCRDYATEKVWKILAINVVPIVLGFANNTELFPPHSVIDVRDFASPRHLADYLKRLDADDTLYNEYFRWRAEFTCGEEDVKQSCKVCRHALDMRGRRELVKDLVAEWDRRQNCGGPKENYRGMEKYLT